MKEYQTIIDKYSLKGYEMYSKVIQRSDWGDIPSGTTYLEKYWLPLSEYEEKWKLIQDKIFINQESGLPELIFSSGYEISVLGGGCLFTEYDFKLLLECITQIGEKEFCVIENNFGDRLEEPLFRMKFPVDITWEEFTSGNFVSSSFIESIHKEFFVFGESALWGKYSASDYEYPLDILGFTSKYRNLFQSTFIQTDQELNDLQVHLPESYKAFLPKRL